MPASSPLGPLITASNSGGPGSELKMMSHSAATAAGVSAQRAPAWMNRWAASRRTSCTIRPSPRAVRPRWRLLAMPAPMVPRPMKPAFMGAGSLRVRLEDFSGDVRGGHRGGPSGVEREVGDHLRQFLLGDAVDQRAFQVAAQLFGAVGGDQRGTDDQAAVTLGKLRTLPYIAEQHFFGEVDQLGDGAADAVARGGRWSLGHGFLLGRVLVVGGGIAHQWGGRVQSGRCLGTWYGGTIRDCAGHRQRPARFIAGQTNDVNGGR